MIEIKKIKNEFYVNRFDLFGSPKEKINVRKVGEIKIIKPDCSLGLNCLPSLDKIIMEEGFEMGKRLRANIEAYTVGPSCSELGYNSRIIEFYEFSETPSWRKK